jgi:hypothetical protein
MAITEPGRVAINQPARQQQARVLAVIRSDPSSQVLVVLPVGSCASLRSGRRHSGQLLCRGNRPSSRNRRSATL